MAGVVGHLRRNVPLANGMMNLVYRKPVPEPLMEKIVFDLNSTFAMLHQLGCGRFHVHFFENRGDLDALTFFAKKRDRASFQDDLLIRGI